MAKIALLLLCLTAAGVCTTKRLITSAAQRARNQTFDTFALIDARLAVLGRLNDEIKQAVVPRQPGHATSTKPGSLARPWMKAAQDAQQTARKIRVLSEEQAKRYRRRKQSFGVRSFQAIAKRAGAVQQAAQKLKRISEEDAAAKQQSIMDQRILSLVLQYQAISGGYGAIHCSATQHVCCQPKLHEDAQKNDGVLACSWTCVASPRSCAKGFTGGGRAARK